MYFKIMHNNMLVDLLTEIKWVRYLPRQKRLVMTDRQSANAIMGSDNDTVYHICGRPFTFNTDVKTVEIIQISEAEYGKLSTEFALIKKENEDLRSEVQSLKNQIENQSNLLAQILAKLG